ncbi:class I SAM-dependent methyltransferase [Streptacidiphilus cavernicola]|uniref:Class I SAM-dependent methyltransferase n=1 Tax=Streptacidiphilus cavernicola TaxID=3342716 RepID=A0ABV6VVN3_9ACTN
MHDDYLSGTIDAYDRNPLRYEEATGAMTPVAELDAFLALLPDPAARVLDVGCAFGRDTALLAERGLRAEGVDLSAGFLERARQLHPELAFGRMDARSLDFPDRTFGGVWCQATLLHLRDEDVAAAFAEFLRVLVPGGALFASFKEGEGEEELVERFSSDGARFYRYQTVPRVTTMLQDAGYRVAAVDRSNEFERFGPGYRDLTWIHAYAVKPAVD